MEPFLSLDMDRGNLGPPYISSAAADRDVPPLLRWTRLVSTEYIGGYNAAYEDLPPLLMGHAASAEGDVPPVLMGTCCRCLRAPVTSAHGTCRLLLELGEVVGRLKRF